MTENEDGCRHFEEYAAPIFDLHTKEKILQVEKVQRRAVKWTTSNYDYLSSVTAMLQGLGWRPYNSDGQTRVSAYFTRLFMALW